IDDEWRFGSFPFCFFFSLSFSYPHFARRLPASNVASNVLQQKGEPAMVRLKATGKGIAFHGGHRRLVDLLWIFPLFSFFNLPLASASSSYLSSAPLSSPLSSMAINMYVTPRHYVRDG